MGSIRPDGLRFGTASSAYELGRPSYPDAAVDWLVPSASERVVEVGAGTGKFTRALVRRGIDVIATEPDAGMRAALTASLPSVRVVAGSAEEIPLPDGCADAVIGAQCWHWVNQARASIEAGRVLAPGGTLGLVWNDRDVADPWVAQMSKILTAADQGRDADVEPVPHPPFGPFERFDVRWLHETTVDGVVDMVASRSYAISLSEEQRIDLLERIRRHALEHPFLASGNRLVVPYLTRVYRAGMS